MRKFLLLTMMCLFGLFTVNAQVTITVGEKTNVDARIPFHTWYKYSYTQQIYTAAEINQEAGTISKIAFNTSGTSYTRNIKVYMQNTTKDNFESVTDWVNILDSDLVFEGSVTTTALMEIVLTTPFEYAGGNMLLCVQDCTGLYPNSTSFDIMAEADGLNRSLMALSDSNQTGPNNLTGDQNNMAALKNVIHLTFSSGTPTYLDAPVVTAKALDDESIVLTWNTVLNAAAYEVYEGDNLVATVSETTYTVTGLEAETQYCYAVKAVNEEYELVSEASAEACAKTSVKLPDNLEIVEVGTDKNPIGGNYYLPVYDYSRYAMSQQIYLAEELAGNEGYNIYNVAFKLSSAKRDPMTRQYEVYVQSTELSAFDGNNFVALSEADKVFDGDVEIEGSIDSWYTINFTTPFEYTGGNIVITVYDKTGTMNNYTYHRFYTYSAAGRALYKQGSTEIDMLGLTTGTTQDKVNQIRFGFGFSEEGMDPSIEVSSETIALGTVASGNYWSEKATSAEVTIETIATTVTSISCDNEFFTLNYDLTANPVVLTVGCNKDMEVSGEQTATVTIKADGADDVTIPVTATAYIPATSDVYELATAITFTDDAYTDTPAFANLNDDYNLPKEVNKGKTPDAVYSFELAKDATVTVNVTGTNSVVAIYDEDFKGEGGPKAKNNNKGVVEGPEGPTSFFYDFQDQSLEHFTLIDANNDGKNWEVTKKYGTEEYHAISYSYQGGNITPDNYMITKDVYSITASSKLSYKYWGVNGNPDYYAVVVSEDGETFESVLEEALPSDASTAKTKEISLSSYAGKTLYIGFRHFNCSGQYYVCIDDFQLTDGTATTRNVEPQISAVYPAGKYYLVAAAEDAFTVNVALTPAPSAAPSNLTATVVSETSIALAWTAAEGEIEGYNIYKDEELFTTVAANVTEYTVEDLDVNTTYCFAVTAVSEGVESFKSNTACATTGDYIITAPTNVVVTALDPFSVELTWDAVEYAQRYNIYIGGELVKSVTGTAYYLEDLTPATEYCFEVSAVRNEQETEKVQACGSTAAIDFNDENLATEFLFDFNDQILTADFMLLDADGDGNGWGASGTANGYDDTYAIRSYSYWYAPLTPDNYIYTKRPYRITENSVVTLNAKCGTGMDSDLGEHYAVVVSEDGENWTIVFEETIEHADWTNTSVSLAEYAGKGVLVGIRHYNCTGFYFLAVDNFALTEVKEPEIPETPEIPAAPVASVKEVTATTVVLEWNAVEGATNYNVYKGEEVLATVTETTYTVTGLTAETEYCFTVTAINEAGESEHSEEVCATTLGDAIAENAVLFNIYPNPASDRVVIETEATIESVSIYTITGVMVYSEADLNNNTIDVSEFNGGVYIMKVRTENGEVVKRFIKK